MVRPGSKGISFATVVLGSALVPAAAQGQSTSIAGPRDAVRAPSLIASVAASPLGLDDWRRSDGPALIGSVQARLNRVLVLEGEVTQWSVDDTFQIPRYVDGQWDYFPDQRNREVWTMGANLLIRGGTSRVTGFAGAGLGVRVSREDHSYTFQCFPRPGAPAMCTGEVVPGSDQRSNTGLTEQFVVGGEFWITPRLAAYGGARFAFSGDDLRTTAGYAPLAGVRVALRTTDATRPTDVGNAAAPGDPSRALGKDVRVTLNDGTKHRGRLQSVAATQVTVAGKDISFADVQKIEKVGHATRNAVGISALAALPMLMVLGPAFDMPSDMSLAIVAAGVGSGIAVGVVIDAARKPGNVVYRAPGTSASFGIAPIVTADRKGVAIVTSW